MTPLPDALARVEKEANDTRRRWGTAPITATADRFLLALADAVLAMGRDTVSVTVDPQVVSLAVDYAMDAMRKEKAPVDAEAQAGAGSKGVSPGPSAASPPDGRTVALEQSSTRDEATLALLNYLSANPGIRIAQAVVNACPRGPGDIAPWVFYTSDAQLLEGLREAAGTPWIDGTQSAQSKTAGAAVVPCALSLSPSEVKFVGVCKACGEPLGNGPINAIHGPKEHAGAWHPQCMPKEYRDVRSVSELVAEEILATGHVSASTSEKMHVLLGVHDPSLPPPSTVQGEDKPGANSAEGPDRAAARQWLHESYANHLGEFSGSVDGLEALLGQARRAGELAMRERAAKECDTLEAEKTGECRKFVRETPAFYWEVKGGELAACELAMNIRALEPKGGG